MLSFPPGDPLGVFIWIAIICCLAWGAWALVKWAGWTIPEPVRIVGIVLLCIFLILLMYRLFRVMV